MSLALKSLADRYSEIVDRLAGFSATLIAVSKTRTADEIEALYRMGHRDFGENYVQELLEKDRVLSSRGIGDIRWHFIGHLQSNKVKVLLPRVALIHSVDSIGVAREISKRALRPMKILLEVNLDAEPSKSGFEPASLTEALKELSMLNNLAISGLMCIPSPNHESVRTPFARLRELRDVNATLLGPGELSMGMSADYPEALQEGSRWIRIGTALFGPRGA
jgi:pyridoxal phosphate enzyme (YggS family)